MEIVNIRKLLSEPNGKEIIKDLEEESNTKLVKRKRINRSLNVEDRFKSSYEKYTCNMYNSCRSDYANYDDTGYDSCYSTNVFGQSNYSYNDADRCCDYSFYEFVFVRSSEYS